MADALLDPVLRADVVEGLPLNAFIAECRMRLTLGQRLFTLFGRAVPDPADTVALRAVFLSESGALELLQGHAARGAHYPSLTPTHAGLHIFERELWEQCGLTPDGHPWLKPVRFAGERQQTMADYPFFSVRGGDVHEVGVGPIHASVIEPAHFRFMCLGERVHHLEIQHGYQHRDVETLLLQRPPLTLTHLIESVSGDTSVANAWAHCAALEALADRPAPLAVEAVRGLALELERIAVHLVALTGLATDIAFLQGSTSYGRLRTAVINASMRICGSRFGRGWLRPGGVRFSIDAAQREDLRKTLTAFRQDLDEVNWLMLHSRTVPPRLQGIGQLPPQAAVELGLWGLVARASGLAVDTRVLLPGALHRAHPIAQHVETSRDCWALFKLRLGEIALSLDWIQTLLAQAEWPEEAKPVAAFSLAPHQLCVSLREGSRGPVLHTLETDAQGNLAHVKLQDPSLQNWFALALSLRDNDISDFPICNKSFDLSYCGTDL